MGDVERKGSKLVIFGSSGFLGSHLISSFAGWQIATVDRKPNVRPGVEAYEWDGKTQGLWFAALRSADAVINLAGAPISLKWTEANRQLIKASRTESARAVGECLQQLEPKPKVWVNASATGFYGDRADTILGEDAEPGEGFLAEICRSWENAAITSIPDGVRLVLLRTGLVLGRDGGALKPLRQLTALGLGGAAGSGRQWMPWIHVEDLCRMIRWGIEHCELSGPLNVCAPEPIRNGGFMAQLRNKLHRPWSPPVPALALQLVGRATGPDASLILSSVRASPEKAKSQGFEWTFPQLSVALADLLDKS